ncbi:MAG: phosphoribosylaminoimidazolesuccinocarboxamide synthase [Nitrososphaerales archaeon]
MTQMLTREGSAKNIMIEKMPKDNEMGIGYFMPKDSFSIFDYKIKAKWPFEIPFKGMAMAHIINKSFEIAQSNGIKTCFIEPIKDGCKIYIFRVPGQDGFPLEPNEIEVGTRNRVVDLEVIFNYYLHPRSSLLKDFQSGKKEFKDYGFSEMPRGGEIIPNAAQSNFKLIYTTKYDKRGDISLTEEEAKVRSRLTDEQWERGQELIKKSLPLIANHSEQKGLLRADGKYELFVDSDGNVGLADTFGNPEEDRYLIELKDISAINRFLDFYQRRWKLDPAKVTAISSEIKNQQGVFQDLSKQFIRNWYTDNGWKKSYQEGKSDVPPMMPKDAISAYRDTMLSFASIWANKTAEIVDQTGILVRPFMEVGSELFALEQLNKHGLSPK